MFLDRRLQTCRRQEERRVELAKAQGEWEGEGRGGARRRARRGGVMRSGCSAEEDEEDGG